MSYPLGKTYGFVNNSKRIDHGMFLVPFLDSSPQKMYLGEISELEHLSKREFKMADLRREIWFK